MLSFNSFKITFIFFFVNGQIKLGTISNRGINTNYRLYNLGCGIIKSNSFTIRSSKNKISKSIIRDR